MALLSSLWFPEHINGTIAPLAQALLYPYPAPEGDFMMANGVPELVPGGIGAEALRGLVPVLSVGSNRAPLQLRRKFGDDCNLPVTAAVLHEADIVFAATLSYYAAVPATAFPSKGTSVQLNVAWLNDAQLLHMHNTEALGIAYDFIRYDELSVSHGARADGDDPVFRQPVFGYESRAGVLAVDGRPVAHAAINAEGRVFPAMDEAAMLAHVRDLSGSGLELEDWIMAMRQNRAARDAVIAQLGGLALRPELVPWTILEAEATDPGAYL